MVCCHRSVPRSCLEHRGSGLPSARLRLHVIATDRYAAVFSGGAALGGIPGPVALHAGRNLYWQSHFLLVAPSTSSSRWALCTRLSCCLWFCPDAPGICQEKAVSAYVCCRRMDLCTQRRQPPAPSRGPPMDLSLGGAGRLRTLLLGRERQP